MQTFLGASGWRALLGGDPATVPTWEARRPTRKLMARLRAVLAKAKASA